MDDEIEESTLIRDGSDSDPERVLETDTNVFQVFTEEENAVSVAEIASNGDDNCKRNQSDAEQHLKFRETSGRETDIKSPGIVESKDEIKNKDVLREKEDTTMTFIMPDKNPYDKAMGYLHTHSLPSLFQYMVINLAYQRPDNAIDFMIAEVTKRSQQQPPKKTG